MDKRLKYLNALHSFESAARHQSYSKAAQELFVSQAAISQQMRHLEENLKEKLFIRRGRSMNLTQSGEKLFKACQLGFSEIIKGLNSIQCEGIAGELTITSTQAFCSLWLMPRLYKFSLAHPEINVKILGSNQVEDIQKKHIDVAIRFGTKNSLDFQESLIAESFGQDYVYPVCAPELINNGCIRSPKDLLNCRLVSLANENIVTWQAWFKHLDIEGYENHIRKTEVTSSDMALSAVLSGHGVTLAASAMFMPYIHTKQLVVPFNVKHPVTWNRFLVYDSDSPKKSRIRIFIDWVKKENEAPIHLE
ncbi:LysR substrate-binding domain-containing protein [Colwelliaceae bacterium 6441]